VCGCAWCGGILDDSCILEGGCLICGSIKDDDDRHKQRVFVKKTKPRLNCKGSEIRL